MKVDEIETLIVSLGGEVPKGNKDVKEDLAKTLAIEYLTEKGVTDLDGDSLDKLAEKIENLDQSTDTPEQGGDDKPSLNPNPEIDPTADYIDVDLQCCVSVGLGDGESVQLLPGEQPLSAELLAQIPSNLYQVLEGE